MSGLIGHSGSTRLGVQVGLVTASYAAVRVKDETPFKKTSVFRNFKNMFFFFLFLFTVVQILSCSEKGSQA